MRTLILLLMWGPTIIGPLCYHESFLYGRQPCQGFCVAHHARTVMLCSVSCQDIINYNSFFTSTSTIRIGSINFSFLGFSAFFMLNFICQKIYTLRIVSKTPSLNVHLVPLPCNLVMSGCKLLPILRKYLLINFDM